MDVSFERNVREVERGLSGFALRQLPFALSLALNATAEDVKRNADKALARRLDRPTRFTLRAFRVLRSTKRRLASAVFAMDRQAAYLVWAERGGERKPTGKAIVVPVGMRTNAHGNIPRGGVKGALAKPGVFSGRAGKRRAPGIYERKPTGGLRLLIAYTPRAGYRPRLRFGEDAAKTARARMPVHFERAMRRALETAKPGP